MAGSSDKQTIAGLCRVETGEVAAAAAAVAGTMRRCAGWNRHNFTSCWPQPA
jgi:hypothetical protein